MNAAWRSLCAFTLSSLDIYVHSTQHIEHKKINTTYHHHHHQHLPASCLFVLVGDTIARRKRGHGAKKTSKVPRAPPRA